MSDPLAAGAHVTQPNAYFAICGSVCAGAEADVCCVAHGCATACEQTGQLHIDPVTAVLLDSCTPGSWLWSPAACTALPQRAYDDMVEICAAHGGPWCAYLDAVRRDRASELALALALGLAAVSAIALVRRLAARRAARLRLNTR